MKSLEVKRQVTRVWLLAELNARLRKVEKLDPQCCGCRIKQLSPLPPGAPANWTIELFGAKCDGPCLGQVSEIVAQMQRHCEIVW
ncbi:MAG: hypothetical protein OSA97_07930 [Nevskia sp.]|nr:hypothetical protein [Nevskia sp.]